MKGGQADGQFRIQDGVVRENGSIIDGGLVVGGGIGDHSGHRGLRAGASRGGNGHEGRDPAAVVDLQQALQLGH